MIRIKAPAKVNLFLRIMAREESGFHQLETLFQALELGDSLTIRPGGRDIALRLDGPPLGTPEENLSYRAARGFRRLAGLEEGVEIHLKKKVPIRAGLGGGSSDAAAVLRVMDTLFPGQVNRKDLLSLAAELGSDVPFFLASSPLALAWGRGQRLLPLSCLPRAPVLVAVPPEGVSTADAYGWLARAREGESAVPRPALHDLRALSDWDAVGQLTENDFERVVFTSHPLLGRLKEAMEGMGSRFALLSGSGSALFAVFREEKEARDAAVRLQASFSGTRFLLTHTLERLPDPIPPPGVEG